MLVDIERSTDVISNLWGGLRSIRLCRRRTLQRNQSDAYRSCQAKDPLRLNLLGETGNCIAALAMHTFYFDIIS